jgi:hypothetical protein
MTPSWWWSVHPPNFATRRHPRTAIAMERELAASGLRATAHPVIVTAR